MKAKIFNANDHQYQYQEELESYTGLRSEWIEEVAEKILTAFNQVTPNDAVCAAGFYSYLTGVRALRDVVCPKGWERLRENNLEITRNPENGVALLVSSGDINTGNKNKTPKTKNPKGEGTKKIVSQNSDGCHLWPEFDEKHTKEVSVGQYWYFLYCVDLNKKQMRTEISLPVGKDFFGSRIDDWKIRIIPPAIDFEPSVVITNPEFAETFDFEIRRKSNDGS